MLHVIDGTFLLLPWPQTEVSTAPWSFSSSCVLLSLDILAVMKVHFHPNVSPTYCMTPITKTTQLSPQLSVWLAQMTTKKCGPLKISQSSVSGLKWLYSSVCVLL